jgi:hypothetical protein
MLVVVGGHSRNIGKTSVVCSIIRSLTDFDWTAIKITQFGHNVCSQDGEPCECSDPKHPIAISEEKGLAPTTDSGRFLAAGARRSYWARTPAGSLAEALPALRRITSNAENVIVESNSLLQFLKPDLYLMVLDGAVKDFKASSLRALDRAHALVVTSGAPLAWPEVPSILLRSKPRYFAPPPCYENAELNDFVRTFAGEPKAFISSRR